MKYRILILLIFNTLNTFSQNYNLEGCWFWDNSDDFDFEIRYENSKCQMIAYGKDNKSILSNDYFYYNISNDTINYINYSEKFDTLMFIYIIENISDSILQLRDIENAIYNYKRICESSPEIKKFKNNEFLYQGNTLVYISESEPDYTISGLKIGWINLNDNFKTITETFGEPYETLKGEDEINNHIFLLDTINENLNYIVVSERNDTLWGIQLTGYLTNQNYNFSSIRLGDYSYFVEKKLGIGSEQVEVEDINGYKWIYDPFPFSIEFIENRVYSIRIYK